MTRNVKSLYEVQAFNDAATSENRIHSDDTAQRFGFEGALVSGAVVFAHMSYLPIKTEGLQWFSDNRIDVRFTKPVYDGDLLTIEHQPSDSGGETRTVNLENTLVATMLAQHDEFAVHAASAIPPATRESERVEISWNKVYTDKPAMAHIWHPDKTSNIRLADQMEDDLTLYREDAAPVHPLWIARQCNAALERSFLLPAWIHVGSKLTFHRPLTVGQQIEVHNVPLTKWRRKGHEFLTLYIAFRVGGSVCLEVEHTSIFNIAPPAGS